MANLPLVDMMENVWLSITRLCENFSEIEWQTPTDCPGWSVQDQIAHMAGSESRLLDRPAPQHIPSDLSHVKNEGGERNEILVDWRRSWSGAEVLEEFKTLIQERLTSLHSLSEKSLDEQLETPMGVTTIREQLNRRIYDAWSHEQDIRRALNLPGHMDGSVPRHVFDRTLMAMPYVVGRKVKADDGATVVIEVTGSISGLVSIDVNGGRANLLDDIPSHPTVSLRMDFQTFTCLGCGRWNTTEVVTSGKVVIAGDHDLGENIIHQMAIVN
jgi:uncharacterized protein (TIGR03083 family)